MALGVFIIIFLMVVIELELLIILWRLTELIRIVLLVLLSMVTPKNRLFWFCFLVFLIRFLNGRINYVHRSLLLARHMVRIALCGPRFRKGFRLRLHRILD